MNYKAIIGLEIHMQLKSNSKLFSSAPNIFGQIPNSSVSPLDMAFPGTMPILNKQCVISAIKLADALHMEICKTITFDRKNYFYSDLPKGYQLTQHFHPFGKNGYLITKNGFKVSINHMHLEEDACKQIHLDDVTLVDYNRAGVGLIEIVTEPIIPNGLEASLFLEEINNIAKSLDVTTGKLQEGALRCDVNVSIYNEDEQLNYPIVELKNLNGFKNVGKAIDAEISRQLSLLDSGQNLKPETRRYDESKNQTVFMRNKNKQLDYKYFADANIVPIVLTDEFINDVLKDKSNDFCLDKFGLSSEEKSTLLKDTWLANLFISLVNSGVDVEIAYNWVAIKINGLRKKNPKLLLKFDEITFLLKKVVNKELDNRQASLVLNEIINNNLSTEAAIKQLGFDNRISYDELSKIIDAVLLEYKQAVKDYIDGKSKAFNYLLGCINKKCQGKANQVVIKEMLLNKIGGK